MLETIIHVSAYASLLLATGAAYLQLNKLWTRKHLSEVAESISIPGILVAAVPVFVFGVYFLYKGELLGIIDSIIWLFCAVLETMIGAGFWVKGQRKKGFFRLAIGSISRERSEITRLAREFVNPSSVPQLIKVLTRMAAVDGNIDQREVDLLQSFSEEWNLKIDWTAIPTDTSSKSRIVEVQEAIGEYLETSPPNTQVAHLMEVLQLLIDVDESSAEEEQLAFNELRGNINQYLSDDPVEEAFTVVIAPQSDQQEEAIRLLLKDINSRPYAGGKGYIIGNYFSRKYAEIICSESRSLGFFTVVMEVASDDPESHQSGNDIEESNGSKPVKVRMPLNPARSTTRGDSIQQH